MPKSSVTDPITDQEIAFARLILSGTMTDRRAAEAVGLNPSTAAYTKSKPRVRDYLTKHRAAVSQKLADQEAEGLRHLNLSRDQILNRLWQLANLSPEQTRGSIAGQIKALAMIVAIEGLIPDRRLSPAHTAPASPPIQAQIYVSEAMRRRGQAEGAGLGETVAAVEDQTAAAPPMPEPASPATPAGDTPSPNLVPDPDRNPTAPGNPSIYPEATNWVPAAYEAGVNTHGPLRLPIPPGFRGFARGRRNL